MIRESRRRKGYQHLLSSDDHDPLSGVSNLFDVAMVFSVALLIALFARVPASELLSRTSQEQPNTVPEEGDPLEKFQVGDREAGGRGERLGVAYRLPSGEVIYVPESQDSR